MVSGLERERKKCNIDPTDKQKECGNYQMGHININGFQITIENPKGSYRKGKDRNGHEWKTFMHNDYGYFTKTLGKDGDAIDVFIGPNMKSKKIFAIDQKVGGKFDETKIMFCFSNAKQAKNAYLSNYDDTWKGFWKITEVDIDAFKKWLYDGHRQYKPFFQYKEFQDFNRMLNEGVEDVIRKATRDYFKNNRKNNIEMAEHYKNIFNSIDGVDFDTLLTIERNPLFSIVDNEFRKIGGTQDLDGVENHEKTVKKDIDAVKKMSEKELSNKLFKTALNESANEDYPYYLEVMEDFRPYNIFEMFAANENPWLPLIDPSMYQKALDEFMQYGKFVHFPVKYIYQWMYIIVKNICILASTTEIAGHTQGWCEDDFVDYFFDGDYDKWEQWKNEHECDDSYGAGTQYLDEIGFYNWCKLPDGSDAWSDYGLPQFEPIIGKFDKDLSPEEILVLINRCLDVAHPRGDISSMFIKGGSKTLSQISNGKYINEKMNKDTLNKIIKESVIKTLKENDMMTGTDDVMDAIIMIKEAYVDIQDYVKNDKAAMLDLSPALGNLRGALKILNGFA